MPNIVAERYFQRAKDIRGMAKSIADPQAKREALNASKRLELQGARSMKRIGRKVTRKKGPRAQV